MNDELTRIEVIHEIINGKPFDKIYYRPRAADIYHFIDEFAKELAVEVNEEGEKLGSFWLSKSDLMISSVTYEEDARWSFRLVYIELLVIQLTLRLIISRMQENKIDIRAAQHHSEGIKDALDWVQNKFENSLYIHFMPEIRKKIDLKRNDILNYSLKMYVKYERMSSSEKMEESKSIEAMLVLRLASERLDLRPRNISGSLNSVITSVYSLIESKTYDAPIIIRGWPKESIYYREIRDPRSRRFSQ